MVTLHDAFASKLRPQRKRLQAMCPKTPMYNIQLQWSFQKKAFFCSFEIPSSPTFRDCLSFKKGINPGNSTLEVPKVIPVFLIRNKFVGHRCCE